MSANVGWSREAYSNGPWNTSDDAAAVVTGISSNALLNNVVITGSSPFNINGLPVTISVGQTNAGSSVFFDTDSFQLNTFLGNVSTGEGREVIITTAGKLSVDQNFSSGWSREEWNVGAWNESVGSVFTGNGNVFSISTAGQFTTSLNSVSVFGNSDITISGEQLNISQGIETVTGTAFFDITGEDLVTATVDSFAVLADGSITINTPTFEANVELNNDGVVVGLASFIDIPGFIANVNLGTVTTTSENIIPITGEELITTANNINLITDQILSMTGNGVTITLANIVPKSDNILPITGRQVNVSINTLKFWDPINDNNQENWTNIH